MKLKELIENCETDIRQGNTEAASLRLREMNLNKIPAELRFPLANLCRRTGLVSTGLKILTPQYMLDREDWLKRVHSNEVAEYALLLQRLGSVNEAMRILDRVDTAAFPDALLYRAYCHFNRWEYGEAIPLLEDYVASPLDEYKVLTGRVNLAAALVSTGDLRASSLLEKLIVDCEKGGHTRLLANCHELKAQLALADIDLRRAKEHIEASMEVLKSSRTLDQLFVRKLQAVMKAIESGSRAPLEDFRNEAVQRLDFESARDIDFFSLKLWFDQKKFDHLIFGTPFPAYRQRVCHLLGREPAGDSFIYGDSGGPVMDVARGQMDGRANLTVGGKVHQLLEILLRDFYRPKTLAALFSELFPEDHFDIFSSTDRVHQILRRARAWIAEESLPAEIVQMDRYYALQVTGPIGFQVNLEREPIDWNQVHLRRLTSLASGDRIYAAKELRSKLGLGLTPFRRFTNWAVDEGQLERSGAGPATAYRLRERKAA